MSHGITWTRVWTLYTPPLAGQTATSFSPRPQEAANRGQESGRNFPQVMSSPQPHGMNRYKTNHAHQSKPERRPE